MRTKKMLTFMVVGAVGLASLWVLGNADLSPLKIEPKTPTLTGITLKQLNLGKENITEWKMNDDTLTVHPKGRESKNTTKNGASQVGGIGNKAHGYTGDISKDSKDDEKYTDRPAFSSVIVVGSDNETSPGARYGAIVASQASSIIANPEGAVVLAAKNAKARGMNSSIVASANESEGQLVVAGSGAAVIASNNANVAEKAEGSLAIGNNISLTHSGVFAFNTKGQNLKSAKDDSFIVNVDHGFLIGKNAPEAPAGTVPLQVNGAIRVATADSQTPENAIVLKTKNLKGKQYSCLCINKEGEGMSLSPAPECNTVCGLPQEGRWECLSREKLFRDAEAEIQVFSYRQNPSHQLAECIGWNCAWERPVCGDRCVQWYEEVDNGDGTLRCEPGTYRCEGPVPANATLIAGDDRGLVRNDPVTVVAKNTSAKCEYTCNAGYELRPGGVCAKAPVCKTSLVAQGWTDSNQPVKSADKIYPITALETHKGSLGPNRNATAWATFYYKDLPSNNSRYGGWCESGRINLTEFDRIYNELGAKKKTEFSYKCISAEDPTYQVSCTARVKPDSNLYIDQHRTSDAQGFKVEKCADGYTLQNGACAKLNACKSWYSWSSSYNGCVKWVSDYKCTNSDWGDDPIETVEARCELERNINYIGSVPTQYQPRDLCASAMSNLSAEERSTDLGRAMCNRIIGGRQWVGGDSSKINIWWSFDQNQVRRKASNRDSSDRALRIHAEPSPKHKPWENHFKNCVYRFGSFTCSDHDGRFPVTMKFLCRYTHQREIKCSNFTNQTQCGEKSDYCSRKQKYKCINKSGGRVDENHCWDIEKN